MPAGLIEEQRSVRARRDLGGDFGQVQVHRLSVASGHDKGCALAVFGADRAEDIGGGGSLILGAFGRVPRLAQRRAILFFWPTRASSANQTSMASGATPFSRAISSRRPGRLPEKLRSRRHLVQHVAESLCAASKVGENPGAISVLIIGGAGVGVVQPMSQRVVE